MSTLSVHQSLGDLMSQAALRPLPLRVAAGVAVALDPASVACRVAMPRAGPQRTRHCPGDGGASAARAAGVDGIARDLVSCDPARLPGHGRGGRDLPRRSVAQPATRPAADGDETRSGHVQNPGLRDSLPRGGQVWAQVVPDVAAQTLLPLLR